MASTLLHIGYIKSGSTYLQKWFSAHPAMYYQPHSIAGFYNADDLGFYAEKPTPIHECFVLSSEDLSVWKSNGSITSITQPPDYNPKAYQEKMCATLKAVYPQGKVLIVTRGYTSIIASFYAEYLNGGGVLKFHELQKAFGGFLVQMLDYSYVVSIYRQTFGADNVIVLPFELLRDKPAEFLSLIETRLGIKQKFSFSADKVNAAMDWQTLTAYRKVSKLLLNVSRILPQGAKQQVFQWYGKRLASVRPLPEMKFIARFISNDINLQGSDELLQTLKGKAELLRNEVLYQPYLKEYLL